MTDLHNTYKVSKSNKLIEARYNLTLNEQRIILSAVSKIEPKQKQPNTIKFEVKYLKELLNIKNDKFVHELKEICGKLGSKNLVIQSLTTEDFITIQWISSAEYISKEGTIELEFSKKMMPYLIDLANNFTTYELENILKLKSRYSIRIYELLKQFQNLKAKDNGCKERVFELNELRDILGMEENKYPKYANFKQKIIDIACSEINQYTDLDVDFEEIKSGKRVEKIKFLFKPKNSCYIEDDEEVQELDIETKIKIDTLKSIIHVELDEKDYISLLNVAEKDLAKILEKYYLIKDKKEITNFTGLLIDAIKNDYKEKRIEDKSKIKTKFHNFEERFNKYNPEELEKIMIENNKKKWGT